MLLLQMESPFQIWINSVFCWASRSSTTGCLMFTVLNLSFQINWMKFWKFTRSKIYPAKVIAIFSAHTVWTEQHPESGDSWKQSKAKFYYTEVNKVQVQQNSHYVQSMQELYLFLKSGYIMFSWKYKHPMQNYYKRIILNVQKSIPCCEHQTDTVTSATDFWEGIKE